MIDLRHRSGRFAIVLLPAILATTAIAVPDDAAWEPLAFLIGNWTGEGTGAPGEGTGGFSFQYDLQGKVLVRKNHADYPRTKDRPAYSHEDLMVIYKESGAAAFRADYFDNEGHVIHYAISITPDHSSVEFVSNPAAAAPRFRFTYKRTGQDTLGIKFEIAPPGKPEAFAPYIDAKARRIGAP